MCVCERERESERERMRENEREIPSLNEQGVWGIDLCVWLGYSRRDRKTGKKVSGTVALNTGVNLSARNLDPPLSRYSFSARWLCAASRKEKKHRQISLLF